MIEEILSNLTFQALTNEIDKVVIAFDKIGFLVIDLLEQFVKIEQELYKDSGILGENLIKQLIKQVLILKLRLKLKLKKTLQDFRLVKKNYLLSLK